MPLPDAYYAQPRFALRAAARLVFPRRCPFCGQVLGTVAECEACESVLDGLDRLPQRRLSAPLYYLGGLEGAAALFHYKGTVRAAVLRTKYKGEAWHCEELGAQLAKRMFGSALGSRWGLVWPQPSPLAGLPGFGYDLLVPVPPSHRKRGYNLPERMGLPLAKALGIPLLPHALERVRAAPHQAGLTMEERFANAAGLYRTAPAYTQAICGKRVLLIDDVITTGATAAACAQALLEGGAASVYAVALCAADPPRQAAAAGHAAGRYQ